MRIKVIIDIDKNTRKFYAFNLFDENLVFVDYSLEEKPPNKRKWTTKEFWSSYSHKMRCYHGATIEQPELTDFIKELALKELNLKLKCLTWGEWRKQ